MNRDRDGHQDYGTLHKHVDAYSKMPRWQKTLGRIILASLTIGGLIVYTYAAFRAIKPTPDQAGAVFSPDMIMALVIATPCMIIGMFSLFAMDASQMAAVILSRMDKLEAEQIAASEAAPSGLAARPNDALSNGEAEQRSRQPMIGDRSGHSRGGSLQNYANAYRQKTRRAWIIGRHVATGLIVLGCLLVSFVLCIFGGLFNLEMNRGATIALICAAPLMLFGAFSRLTSDLQEIAHVILQRLEKLENAASQSSEAESDEA